MKKLHITIFYSLIIIFFVSYFFYYKKPIDYSLFHHVFSSWGKCVAGDFIIQTTSWAISKESFLGTVDEKRESDWIITSYSLDSFAIDTSVLQVFCENDGTYVAWSWSDNLYQNGWFAYHNRFLLKHFFTLLWEKKRENVVAIMKKYSWENYLLPLYIPLNIFSFSIADEWIHGIGFDSHWIAIVYYRFFEKDNELVFKYTPLMFLGDKSLDYETEQWDDCYVDPWYEQKEKKCYTFFESEREKYLQEKVSFFDQYNDIIKK